MIRRDFATPFNSKFLVEILVSIDGRYISLRRKIVEILYNQKLLGPINVEFFLIFVYEYHTLLSLMKSYKCQK